MDTTKKKQLQTNSSNISERIAISSESNILDGEIDPRFGRAAGFVIFNLNTGEFEYLDNGASQIKSQGAGIKTAATLAQKDVSAVLTGFVGPKAYKVLESAGIKIAQNLFGISVRKAINLYKKEKILFSRSPRGGPRNKRQRS